MTETKSSSSLILNIDRLYLNVYIPIFICIDLWRVLAQHNFSYTFLLGPVEILHTNYVIHFQINQSNLNFKSNGIGFNFQDRQGLYEKKKIILKTLYF